MRPLLITLLSGWAILPGLAEAQSPPDTARYVRRVEINAQNVFPNADPDNASAARLANRLHIVTKDRVIRREVLMKPGQRYEQDLLEESERRLRRLSFLGEAEVRVVDAGPDSVDILVRTRDHWSTTLGGSIESGGGLTQIGGSLKESNLFGLGKQVSIDGFWENDVGLTWTFGLLDPHVFGSAYRLVGLYQTGPLVQTVIGGFQRPFDGPDAKWAYGITGFATDEDVRLFQSGSEASRYNIKSQYLDGWARHAFGERFKKKTLEVSYTYSNRDFDSLGTLTRAPLAEDEEANTTTAGIVIVNQKFVKETQIDKFVAVEDFTLGPRGSLYLGRSGFPIPAGVKRWRLNSSYRHRFQLWPKQLLFLTGKFETLFDRDWILTLVGRTYQKAFWNQTIAINVEFTHAWELESSKQFTIGGESGLRGYPARAFNGDKRFQLNLEDRILAPFQVFTVSSSVVAFMDAGFAWQRGRSVDLADLKYSVGLGFRFGFTRFPDSPVWRIDFGWPLDQGDGLGIVLGLEQLFSAE